MYERKDRYYRQAKAEGLRSRAAFKLEDVARDLIRPGDRVVDLGAWPGGWLQVAARRVGAAGRVVGVDLRPIAPLGLRNVCTIVGDAADPQTLAQVREALGGPADVVLSDMAPALTGVKTHDQARAEALVREALAAARVLLRPGGRMVCKLFMGPGYGRLVAEIEGVFERVSVTRSQATRKGSAELYAIARGFKSP